MLKKASLNKYIAIWGLLLFVMLFLSSCTTKSPQRDNSSPVAPSPGISVTFTDALEQKITVGSAKRVVALQGSFAEAWLSAGGTLVGVTDDAYSERDLLLPDKVVTVGSLKNPSLERILALNPDFVILSADIGSQLELSPLLKQAGITVASFDVNHFADYLAMLAVFTQITGRADLYEQNGTSVQRQIDAVLASVPENISPSVLFIRAFASGYRAKNSRSMTGAILKDLGVVNIADSASLRLEDLSLEKIIEMNPDYILVVTMGANEKKALGLLDKQLCSNPAWSSLSAVKNGHYHILPRELFHYKPNARWGESYEYLAELLYDR